MRVTLKRLVIDGSLRWAEAQVQAVGIAPDPSMGPGPGAGLADVPDSLSVKNKERRRRMRSGARGGVVCVRVKVRLTAGDTLAQIRERARDEALRYLDVE
jgi:hypothetical protein